MAVPFSATGAQRWLPIPCPHTRAHTRTPDTHHPPARPPRPRRRGLGRRKTASLAPVCTAALTAKWRAAQRIPWHGRLGHGEAARGLADTPPREGARARRMHAWRGMRWPRHGDGMRWLGRLTGTHSVREYCVTNSLAPVTSESVSNHNRGSERRGAHPSTNMSMPVSYLRQGRHWSIRSGGCSGRAYTHARARGS